MEPFTSLTTVDYDDSIPTSRLAWTVSYPGAALGQMYLSMLVAGLVGLHLTSRQRPTA